MTKEELNTLATDLGNKNATHVKELFDAARQEDAEKATAMEAKLMNILGPESEHMKAVQTQLDQIATDIKKAASQEVQFKTLNEHIALACKDEAFQNIRKNRGSYQIEVPMDLELGMGQKATMLNSGQVNAIPKPTWIPGVSKTPDQQPFVADLCPIVPTTSNTVYYVDRTARTAAAAAVTEGDALPQDDMTYTQQSAAIVDYGAHIKISDNMLTDNDWVAGEINAELPWDVMDTLDGAIVTAALAAATTYSVSGKPYDSTVIEANEYDALRTAINQARVANYRPDTCLVNHDDYTMMELAKATDGIYAIPPFFSSQGLRVSNVPIIPSNSITSGTFLVASFNRSKLAMRQNMILEFGYDADDFTKRLITVRAYIRAKWILSAQHAGGFITTTFATAKAALLKP